MYCGSCLHGNTLAAALHAAGADVLLAPLYTPLRTDEERRRRRRASPSAASTSICNSTGVSSVTRLGGWTACWTALPCSAGRAAARRHAAGETGPLAVSMLRGEEGRQRKELKKLLRWLETDIRPDVVHLSTCCSAAWRGNSAHGWACRWWPRSRAKTSFWRSCRSRTTTPPAASCGAGPPTWTPWWR